MEEGVWSVMEEKRPLRETKKLEIALLKSQKRAEHNRVCAMSIRPEIRKLEPQTHGRQSSLRNLPMHGTARRHHRSLFSMGHVQKQQNLSDVAPSDKRRTFGRQACKKNNPRKKRAKTELTRVSGWVGEYNVPERT